MTANPEYDYGSFAVCAKRFLAIAQPEVKIKPLLTDIRRGIVYFTVENDDYPGLIAVEFNKYDPVNHYFL